MKSWLQKIKNLIPIRSKKTASRITDITDYLDDEQISCFGTFTIE